MKDRRILKKTDIFNSNLWVSAAIVDSMNTLDLYLGYTPDGGTENVANGIDPYVT